MNNEMKELKAIEAWWSEDRRTAMPPEVWNSMTVEIVVASYMEDLKWCAMWEFFNPMMELIPNCKITVYRTGQRNADCLHLKQEVTYLENKGREAGQWLAHIVQRYDSLADVTLFLQGDLGVGYGRATFWPLDLNLFKRFRFPKQSCCGGEPGPIDDFSFFTWPAFDRVRCEVNTPGFTEKHNFGVGPNRQAASDGGHFETARLLHGESCPKEIILAGAANYGGAQFMVTRNLIRRKSMAYYERLLNNAKKYELAHALEHGGWPALVFDIYNQFPDTDKFGKVVDASGRLGT